MYFGWTIPPLSGAKEPTLDILVDNLEYVLRRHMWWVGGLTRSSDERRSGCAVWSGDLAHKLVCEVQVPWGVEPTELRAAVAAGLDDLWKIDSDRARADRNGRVWQLLSAMRDRDSLADDDLFGRTHLAHFTGHPDRFTSRFLGIVQTDADTSAALARKWLRPERMASVWLEPQRLKVDGGAAVAGAKFKTPALPDWTPVDPRLERLDVSKLGNGVEMWAMQLGQVPVARVQISLGRGWVTSPAPGIATLQQLLPKRGGTYHDWNDDPRRRVGVSTAPWFLATTQGTRGVGASPHVDVMMWGLRGSMEELAYDMTGRQSALDKQVQGSLDDFEHWPWAISRWLRDRHLLGDHRAAMPWWERNRAARYVSGKQVDAWARQLRRPENANMVVVSERPLAEVKAEAQRYLGTWSAKGTPTAMPVVPEVGPVPERVIMALDMGAPLTDVRITCRLPGRTPDVDPALQLAASAVRHVVFRTLRESGAAYSPHTSLRDMSPDVTLLEVGVDVAAAAAPGTVKQVLAILGAMSKGVPDRLLAQRKLAVVADHGLAFATGGGAFTALATAQERGWSAEQLAGWPAAVAAVTGEQVAVVLSGCLGHEAVTVIGEGAAATLAAAGLEVVAFDWKKEGEQVAERMR